MFWIEACEWGQKMTPLGSNPEKARALVHITWGCYPRRSFGLAARIENRKELDQWEAKFPSWDVGSYTLRSMPKLNTPDVFEAAP
jgi:hypothetical protein